MWDLNFISENDFKTHIKKTIQEYEKVFQSIDLKQFNSNLIDPIKLLFDQNIYNKNLTQLIEDEIFRQRDKSNSNIIGYFHQNIFNYIKNCKVPENGFDIIFNDKIFVEMKNKHNTMNSSSSAKTMMRMQSKILENNTYECYLVEIIAKKSQNITWEATVDKNKISNTRIRRVSIDKFYEIVTNDTLAFYKICNKLQSIIHTTIKENPILTVQKDTVIDELKQKHKDINQALFLLAFSSYLGFNNKANKE